MHNGAIDGSVALVPIYGKYIPYLSGILHSHSVSYQDTIKKLKIEE